MLLARISRNRATIKILHNGRTPRIAHHPQDNRFKSAKDFQPRCHVDGFFAWPFPTKTKVIFSSKSLYLSHVSSRCGEP